VLPADFSGEFTRSWAENLYKRSKATVGYICFLTWHHSITTPKHFLTPVPVLKQFLLVFSSLDSNVSCLSLLHCLTGTIFIPFSVSSLFSPFLFFFLFFLPSVKLTVVLMLQLIKVHPHVILIISSLHCCGSSTTSLLTDPFIIFKSSLEFFHLLIFFFCPSIPLLSFNPQAPHRPVSITSEDIMLT